MAAGRAGHLPWLALGAMILVHLHVAQILFAGVISLAASAALAVDWWRAGRGRALVRQHAKAIGASGIVILFSGARRARAGFAPSEQSG